MFDIVIPLGPNERNKIHKQIEYTKKNVIGYRNIYIITNNYDNLQVEGCKVIDESIFPFSINDIASYFIQHKGKKNRNGWYFQQLIKLYISFAIEEILDNYLIIDSDVYFLKPLNFMDGEKFIFTVWNEYHIPYFEHMKRLHNSFNKMTKHSGIAHHMLFNRNYIKELFYIVESTHYKPFWVCFIEAVKEHLKYPSDYVESGASEYELYFNFMIKNHSDKIILRTLNWVNQPRYYDINTPSNYDYVSICEWWK